MAEPAITPINQIEANRTGARRVLRGLVLASTDPSEEAQKRITAQLETLDDVRLVALATEALANIKRVKVGYDALEADLKAMRKALEVIRADHASMESVLADAEKAIRERDDIAAKYQELKKQFDPEKQQLEIMYAIEEATKAQRDESAALRRELAQRGSEVENLRASKKRLREALDRLAGKD